MRDVETLIVGGGPAGSSCAWELRRRGLECLILERQELPKRKLCAGWITPKVLADLEIAPADYPHGLRTLDRIRVYLGSTALRATHRTLQYSIRRVEFDNWLLERSAVEVVRHAVRRVESARGSFVVDGSFRCRNLVGAGGTSCPVKRALFGPERGRLILTQEVEFEAEPRDPVCTLFYPFAGAGGYAWYVPKRGAVNVGFGAAAARLRGNVKSHWERLVRLLLKRGLLDAAPPEPGSHPYYVGDRGKEVRRGNAYIVGDAAGLATCDLGEGIGPAVESGLWAARSIAGAGDYDCGLVAPLSLRGLAGRAMARLVCGPLRS